MSRSIEEQVELAMATWTYANGAHDVRRLLRETMNGKYAEPPLPEVIIPKPLKWAKVVGPYDGDYHVEGAEYGFHVWRFTGPIRATAREAIECWNEVFRD